MQILSPNNIFPAYGLIIVNGNIGSLGWTNLCNISILSNSNPIYVSE